jgi:predicted negative regulator of RcsB-dependent stress response
MAYDLEEQEKLDAIRAWWDRYGTLCVSLAFVVVAAIGGWRGWQWYQDHTASQAMGYFEALERTVGQEGDDALARLKAASQTLRNDFPSSGYTPRAVVLAAAELQRRGDLGAAREQLEWLIKQGKGPAFVQLARLRLAGVLLQQKQYDAALAQLENAPKAFAGLYADRRGDILFAQGKQKQAREAWQQALKDLENDPAEQLVQLKLDALAGA